jgi:hypothetical protein
MAGAGCFHICCCDLLAGYAAVTVSRKVPSFAVSRYPWEGRAASFPPTQRGDLNRSVEKGGLHLPTQRAEDVLDLDTTLDKSLRGLKDQAVLLMLRNREIQSALDGLGVRLGMRWSLGTLDLG